MNYLKPSLLRFQALTGRERLLAAAAAVVVLTALMDLTLLGPQRKSNSALEQQLVQQKSALNAMAKVLVNPMTSRLPDAVNAERDDLRLRVALAESARGPTLSDARLSEIVRTLVATRPDLALVSLKTLAPEELYKSQTVLASAPQNALLAAKAQPSALYKHGVEVVVRGPYAALLAYMQTLQGNPNRLFWFKVKLDVQAYPQAVLMLTLYTVSDRLDSPLG